MKDHFRLRDSSNAILSKLIKAQPNTEVLDLPCQPIQSLYDAIFAHTKTAPTVPAMANALNLKEARENLPVSKYRQNILSAISENQTIVVSGETGKYLRQLKMTNNKT